MKKICALLFLSFLHFTLLAQTSISLDRPSITPVSSNASAMERYVAYPVDHSTGVPNINIPLYEIKVGDLVLPISISYHSAGLRPKEKSGRVGTGWTLNAEPSIMRNIIGTADDAVKPWLHTGFMHSLYRPSLPGSWEEQQREEARRKIDKEWDGESDKYVYNLNPGGGTGFLVPGYGYSYLVSHPRNNDIITTRIGSKPDFLIKTPKGVSYSFGNTEYSEEKCGDDVTRWMCDTISSPQTKAKITFDYIREKELNPALYYGMNDLLIIEDNINNSPSDDERKTLLTVQYGLANLHYWLSSNSEKELVYNDKSYLPVSRFKGPERISVSKLETINFGQNKATFFYDGNGLSFIMIKDANGQIFRSIEFFISKYNPSTELTRLDSVKISAPGCESQTYSFQYYNDYAVPTLFTTSVDHWGFANHQDHDPYYDGTLITVPTIKTKTNFYSNGKTTLQYHQIDGANREPDSSWTMAGVLRQITNPEGIQTQFKYSGNKAAFSMYYRGVNEQYDQYLYPVGGLKVDRITTINPKEQTHTYRDFKYGLKNGYGEGLEYVMWGGGAIKHIVTDRDYCIEHTQIMGTEIGGAGKTSRIRTWSSMPISDITFNNGSAVLYNTVVESTGSLQDADIFKTVYHYEVACHPFEDVFLWDSYNAPHPKIQELDYNYNSRHMEIVRESIIRPFDITDTFWDSDHQYGHLNKAEYFKQDTLALVKNYKYENIFETQGDTRGINIYRPYRLESFIPNYRDDYGESSKKNKDQYSIHISGDSYWPMGTSKWKALINESTIEYNYTSGVPKEISSSKAYEYPIYNNINPATITVENSNQPTIHTYEYLDGFNDVLSYHKQALGESSQERKIEFAEGTTRPHRVASKTHLSPVFENEITYQEYDAYGNIAFVTGRDGIHTCYIWGYDNQHVLAQIVNVSYPQLLAALQKDSAWIKDLANLPEPAESHLELLNGLRNVLKTAQVTTYTYKPLRGVASICDPASRTTYFHHDYYGRLTESYRLENGEKIYLQQHVYNFSGKDANSEAAQSGKLIGVRILNSLDASFIYLTGNNEHWVVEIEGGSGFYKAEWKIGTMTTANAVFSVTQTREYIYSEDKVTRSTTNMTVPTMPQGSIGRIYCKITDLVTGISKDIAGNFYASPEGQNHPTIP